MVVFFFFFKQKTAYEIMPSLVGSEMCIRDRSRPGARGRPGRGDTTHGPSGCAGRARRRWGWSSELSSSPDRAVLPGRDRDIMKSTAYVQWYRLHNRPAPRVRRMPTTITDVAAQAGVSSATA